MELDLNELERLAKDATPQEIDASEIIEDDEGKYIECPICGGEGHVSLEADYCNFDGVAIGVQFYGIGKERGAAERYYRAANPAVVLELVRRLRAAEKEANKMREALQLIADMKDQTYYKVNPKETVKDAHLIAVGALADSTKAEG